MKDFLKLFETVMDFKGLSFLVTEKSLIKKQRPVFFFATVITPVMGNQMSGYTFQNVTCATIHPT